MKSIGHIALVVPDPRAAEAYFQQLFDMVLIGREVPLDDGLWYTLPFDKNWEDAQRAGFEPGMVALRNGAFVLALFQGVTPPGQVIAIGLHFPKDEIARLRVRLPRDVQLIDDTPVNISFRDCHQIIWQISLPENDFRTAGDFAGRWLQL